MILAQNYPTSYLRLTACQRAHTSGPVAACDDHVMSEVKFEVAVPFLLFGRFVLMNDFFCNLRQVLFCIHCQNALK